VIAAGLLVTFTATGVATPRSALAQTPRLTPPPPCRVAPADTAVLASARVDGRRDVTSIAVLEFDSRIVDARRSHLASAVTAQLRTRLAAIRGVAVESRGTVERRFSAAGGRIDSLLSALGDQYAVVGEVIPQRDRIDVTVRILQVGKEGPRWERVFAYPRTSVRQIEESVAAAVAELAESRVPPTLLGMSAEAYEITLRGDYFLARHDAASADSARRTYERALAVDRRASIAAARAARARAEYLDRTGRSDARTVGEQVLAGMAMVDTALRLDSSNAEAWTARAMLLRYRNPASYSGALAAHERAVAADPNSADAQEAYGVTLMSLGRDAAAEQHLHRALALEANRATALRALGEFEYFHRRYGPSCALANASIGADSYDPLAYALRARVRMELSEFRDALSDAETARRLSPAPWSRALQLLVTASGTTVDDARLEVKRVVAAKLRPGVKMTVPEGAFTSLALEALGDRDRALEALRRVEPTGVQFAMALRDPRFDQMRSDARFRRITASAPKPGPSESESTGGAAAKRLVGSPPP
jgi:tetratricopeptide (TPR) repeat protein